MRERMTAETLRAQLPLGRKGRPMAAKFDGACAACDVAILPGDPILYDGRTICSGCATDDGVDL
jgi:hypothetical protein